MRVFNKYAYCRYHGCKVSSLTHDIRAKVCHLKKVTDGKVLTVVRTFDSDYWWETECTPKEYHMMQYAKKSRVRKKYRNRIERRL